MKELKAIPAWMASEVRPLLPGIQLEDYILFLDMMFHYTQKSGLRLRHAAETATLPELKSFLSELAAEEQEHYRLAEADLGAFGRRPSQQIPREVEDFHAFWTGVDAPGQLGYLGALVALEGVGQYLDIDVKRALGGLGLDKTRARFILVHLEVDPDHGARADALAEKLGAQNPEALLDGALKAGQFWVAIHQRALGRGAYG